ncbi:hypothetical protein V8C86DRAFT_1573762 [Haematococcus lacustris]
MEAGAVEHVRGHLVLSVQEASGKSQKDLFTWEGIGTGGQFEAFLKVELRGQARSIKAKTQKAPLTGDLIVWKEELKLEVLEGAGELRLMLCREKIQGNKRGTSVIAACGIFLDDILKAVPIDKYFELFKPSGGDGGCLRISMKYIPTTSGTFSIIMHSRPSVHSQPSVQRTRPVAQESKVLQRIL